MHFRGQGRRAEKFYATFAGVQTGTVVHYYENTRLVHIKEIYYHYLVHCIDLFADLGSY